MLGKSVIGVMVSCPCCLICQSLISVRTDLPIFSSPHFMGSVEKVRVLCLCLFIFSLAQEVGVSAAERWQRSGVAGPEHPMQMDWLTPSPLYFA